MSQEAPKLKQKEYKVLTKKGRETTTIESEERLLEEAAQKVSREIAENLKIKVKKINGIKKTDFQGRDMSLTIDLEDLFGLKTSFITNKRLKEICKHLESKFPDLALEFNEVDGSFRDSQIIVKLRRQGAGYGL